MKKKQFGIIYIVISSFCFAMMNVFVRLSGDLPAVQKSFFRNLVALVVALVILMRDKAWFSGKKENIKYLFLRSAAGTLGILCNFYAVDHLILSDASMLNKMSPFFVIIFSFFVLKEKIKPAQMAIVIGAFLGSLLVIKPTASILQSPASIVGLLGGMAAGLAYTYVRYLGEHEEKGPFIVFVFSSFSCLVTLPFVILNYNPMSIRQLMCLLLAGICAAGGQFAITTAYFYAPAREISVYDYSQIIFSAILGLIIFHQLPDAYSWIGYIVICAMAVLMYFYNNKWSRKKG